MGSEKRDFRETGGKALQFGAIGGYRDVSISNAERYNSYLDHNIWSFVQLEPQLSQQVGSLMRQEEEAGRMGWLDRRRQLTQRIDTMVRFMGTVSTSRGDKG